ncbi:MAG: hypothetical protein NW215_03640 [Hyphomicrobiales bacterium]|nr:hypothetical protein [Hyphomicrobiales bacterium]
MSQSSPPFHRRTQDYAAMESAIMQSERGRSFLREYLRRHRSAETRALLRAIAKLERRLSDGAGEARLRAVRRDLTELQRSIARSRRALAAATPAYASRATLSLPSTAPLRDEARDAIDTVSKAATAIVSASVMLRETGAQDRLCAQIERQADAIRDASAVLRMNEERRRKLEAAFMQVEAEVLALIELMDFNAPAAAEAEGAPRPLDPARMNGIAEELSWAMLTDAQKAALLN